jgi:hypothetical protein
MIENRQVEFRALYVGIVVVLSDGVFDNSPNDSACDDNLISRG